MESTEATAASQPRPDPDAIVRVEAGTTGPRVRLLTSRLDRTTLPYVADTIRAALPEGDEVLVDLGPLVYLDIFGFDFLLDLVARHSGRLRFVVADEGVASSFRLAHLDSLLGRRDAGSASG